MALLRTQTSGTRRINGTDWPIEHQLHAYSPFAGTRGKTRYLVVIGLCNGVPRQSIEFPNLDEAVEYFEAL